MANRYNPYNNSPSGYKSSGKGFAFGKADHPYGKFGSNHQVPSFLPVAGGNSPFTAAAELTKTKMCAHFMEGLCRKGIGCNFAHGAHELRGGVDSPRIYLPAINHHAVGARSPGRIEDPRRALPEISRSGVAGNAPAPLPVAELVKTKMCGHFMDGFCKKGAACNFAHSAEELRGGEEICQVSAAAVSWDSAGAGASAVVPMGELAKTKMCGHFMDGFCRKGASCNFAHSAEELRSGVEGPNMFAPQINRGSVATGAPTSVPIEELSKTKLCAHFMEGLCKKGMSCNFAHGAHELRDGLESPPMGTLSTNWDGAGVGAPAPLPVAELVKTKMCGHFMDGFCRKGADCNFAHSASELRSGVHRPSTAAPAMGWGYAGAGALAMSVPVTNRGTVGARVTASVPVTELAKTKMCAHFMQGLCKKGFACNFAHGKHELHGWLEGPPIRPPAMPQGPFVATVAAPAPKEELAKTKLCTHFEQGSCKKGSACNYAHGLHELRDGTEIPLADLGAPAQGGKTKLCAFFEEGSCKKGMACNFAHGAHELQGLDDEEVGEESMEPLFN